MLDSGTIDRFLIQIRSKIRLRSIETDLGSEPSWFALDPTHLHP